MSLFIHSLTDHTKTTCLSAENRDDKITGKNSIIDSVLLALTIEGPCPNHLGLARINRTTWQTRSQHTITLPLRKNIHFAFTIRIFTLVFTIYNLFGQESSLLLLNHREYIHFHRKNHVGLYNNTLFGQKYSLLLFQNIFTKCLT